MIGINYGASTISAAWIPPQTGVPQVLTFDKQGSTSLSALLVHTDRGFVVGKEADVALLDFNRLEATARMKMMERVVMNLRDMLTPGLTEHINGRDYTHEQLLGIFFSLVLEKIERVCPSEYCRDFVVVTHPVDMAHHQVQMIIDALHHTGIDRVKMMAEPFAAVRGYQLTHNVDDGQALLLVDSGATRTDVCYLKNINGKMHILAMPRTNTCCGGQDLDYLLYEHLRNQLIKLRGIDISAKGIDHAMMGECKKLRESFSHTDDDVVEADIPMMGNYRMSREAFNALLYPKIDEMAGVARAVADEVKTHQQKVDKVLLIGGCTKMPLLRSHLQEVLGEGIVLEPVADAAVMAKGAIAQYGMAPDGPLNPQAKTTCKKCGSPLCYRYKRPVPGRGYLYRCMECGWEGTNVVVVFH